jgi:hypothetical protein
MGFWFLDLVESAASSMVGSSRQGIAPITRDEEIVENKKIY